MLKKILRPLVAVLLAVAVFALVWMVGIWAHWPLRVSLPLGILVVVAVFSGRRILLFLRRKVAQRKLRTSAMTDRRAGRLLAIGNIWKEARHNVKGAGGMLTGPLSTLPFYLVLGNTGSGKTTLLVNANIPLRFHPPSKDDIPPPTDTVDFMLEDQAILLDTSGRYVALDPAEDTTAEWELVLGLLRRTRIREPLNGVVVTVSVEDLYDLDAVRLARLSQNLRQRIDSLMRAMNVRFPVYVMVSKLDLVAGFRSFLDAVPVSRTGETMGVLAEKEESWDRTLGRGVRELSERVRSLMFRRADAPAPTPEALAFPLELRGLEPLLAPFLRGLFEPSPYLHLPVFRGLFFSSGLLGTPKFSTILGHDFARSRSSEVEILDRSPGVSLPGRERGPEGRETPKLGGATGTPGAPVAVSPDGGGISRLSGVFLRDFFARRLPEDRTLSVPYGLVARWRQFSANILLMGWIGANFVVGLYLVYSFVYNYRTVRTLEARQPGPVRVEGDFHQNMESMERYRSLIDWMGRRDASFSARVLAFSGETKTIEGAMKERYTQEFASAILPVLDRSLRTEVRKLLLRDPDHRLADDVDILVRRINLIEDRLGGADFAALAALPQPGTRDLTVLDSSISPQEARHFSDLILAYIAWAPSDAVHRELDSLQSLLLEVEQTVPDFHWLVDWVNARDKEAVTLSDFWKGSVKAAGETVVLPAFTNDGMRRIFDFLSEVRKASPANFPIEEHTKSFLAWYWSRKEEAWFGFVRGFGKGEETLADVLQWKTVFQSLPGSGNPYLALARRLSKEFPPSQDTYHERWQAFLRAYLRIADTRGAGAGIVSRLRGYAGALDASGRAGLRGGPREGQRTMMALVSAGKDYGQFSADLAAAVSEGLKGRGHALTLAADYYGFSRKGTAKVPVLVSARSRLGSMKKALLPRSDPKEKIVWGLVEGPFLTALDFVDREAACEIGDRWMADVVSPAQASLSGGDLDRFLLGREGAIPAFMKKYMGPFVKRGPSGYRLVVKDGRSVAIRPSFLTFVNAAISGRRSFELAEKRSEIRSKKRHLDLVTLRQSLGMQEKSDRKKILEMAKTQFPVVLKALPTDVSSGALARPYLTRLTLACAEKTHVLNNLNLPVRRSWVWSSLTCGRTTLEVHLGKLVAVRDYPGKDGFVHFLQQFYQGSLTLAPRDFPLQKEALENLRVKTLTLHYQCRGVHALLARYKEYRQARVSLDSIREKIRQIDSELALQDANALEDQNAALKNRPFAASRLPSSIALCLPGESQGAPVSGSPGQPL